MESGTLGTWNHDEKYYPYEETAMSKDKGATSLPVVSPVF